MNESLKTKGLLPKYIVRKADKSKVDPNAEYFVLRLDPYGDDIRHMDACRAAILTYASNIAFHLPKLAEEIIKKYGMSYSRFDSGGLDKLRELLRTHEDILHWKEGRNECERVAAILNNYQRKAAEGIAERKEFVENAISQFLALRLSIEMIGMADTHGEKAARLRGFIQLLDTTIDKLRNEQRDGVERHWPHFGFGGRSDYPYKEILYKLDQLKQENADLKKRLAELEAPKAEAQS